MALEKPEKLQEFFLLLCGHPAFSDTTEVLGNFLSIGETCSETHVLIHVRHGLGRESLRWQ